MTLKESIRWNEEKRFYVQGLEVSTTEKLPAGILHAYGMAKVLSFETSLTDGIISVNIVGADGDTVVEANQRIPLAGKVYELKVVADVPNRVIQR